MISAMPSGYIPIFIFLAIAIVFPVVTIMAAKLDAARSSFVEAVKPALPSFSSEECANCFRNTEYAST